MSHFSIFKDVMIYLLLSGITAPLKTLIINLKNQLINTL